MNKILLLYETFRKEILDNIISKRKTYINKWRKHTILQTEDFINYLNEIKEIDYTKFKYKQTPYSIDIYPSTEFMEIYNNICIVTKSIYNNNLYFQFSIDETDNNRIDFIGGIPEILQGAGIALNLYLLIIKNNNYISSIVGINPLAINLWYSLLQTKDIYGMTNNKISVVVFKHLSNIKLKEILDILPKDLILDEELEEKIIEIYGTMDTYKQRN